MPYKWCPYKKMKFGHRHGGRKDDMKTQEENGHLQGKVRDPWTDPSLMALRRNQPFQHLDLTLLTTRTIRKLIYVG